MHMVCICHAYGHKGLGNTFVSICVAYAYHMHLMHMIIICLGHCPWCESRRKIQRFHVTASKSWHRLFRCLTLHWSGSALPEEFLQSYHPECLISESGD